MNSGANLKMQTTPQNQKQNEKQVLWNFNYYFLWTKIISKNNLPYSISVFSSHQLDKSCEVVYASRNISTDIIQSIETFLFRFGIVDESAKLIKEFIKEI